MLYVSCKLNDLDTIILCKKIYYVVVSSHHLHQRWTITGSRVFCKLVLITSVIIFITTVVGILYLCKYGLLKLWHHYHSSNPRLSYFKIIRFFERSTIHFFNGPCTLIIVNYQLFIFLHLTMDWKKWNYAHASKYLCIIYYEITQYLLYYFIVKCGELIFFKRSSVIIISFYRKSLYKYLYVIYTYI